MEQDPNTRQGWLQTRVITPVRGLLLDGLTPERLALALAAGVVCGVFPALGATTLLCAIVGFAFGLNQVALQTANYVVYPLQFALLLPFFQGGATLFGVNVPVSSAAEVAELTQADMLGAIVLLWDVSWRAMVLWLLLALPATGLIALGLRPILRRFAGRLSPAS